MTTDFLPFPLRSRFKMLFASRLAVGENTSEQPSLMYSRAEHRHGQKWIKPVYQANEGCEATIRQFLIDRGRMDVGRWAIAVAGNKPSTPICKCTTKPSSL